MKIMMKTASGLYRALGFRYCDKCFTHIISCNSCASPYIPILQKRKSRLKSGPIGSHSQPSVKWDRNLDQSETRDPTHSACWLLAVPQFAHWAKEHTPWLGESHAAMLHQRHGPQI